MAVEQLLVPEAPVRQEGGKDQHGAERDAMRAGAANTVERRVAAGAEDAGCSVGTPDGTHGIEARACKIGRILVRRSGCAEFITSGTLGQCKAYQ